MCEIKRTKADVPASPRRHSGRAGTFVSSILSRSSHPVRKGPPRPGKSAWEGEDDGDEHYAHGHVVVPRPDQRDVLQADEDDGAEYRPQEVPEAAQHRGQDQLRRKQPVQLFGRDLAAQLAVKRAGKGDEGAREDEGVPAGTGGPERRWRRPSGRCRGWPGAPFRTASGRSATTEPPMGRRPPQ